MTILDYNENVLSVNCFCLCHIFLRLYIVENLHNSFFSIISIVFIYIFYAFAHTEFSMCKFYIVIY